MAWDHWDEDEDEPELDDPGWCEECQCPIGVGTCGGCVAVASLEPPLLPPYQG